MGTYVFEYENLIAGVVPPCEIKSVQLAASQGQLKRGSLIAIDATGSGTFAANLTSAKGAGILTDDVDATQATPAQIYCKGNFNEDKVILSTGKAPTAGDKVIAESFGIRFTKTIPANPAVHVETAAEEENDKTSEGTSGTEGQ